jgi:hypothetical protein
MEYNNIRAIASEASGLVGQAFSAQVNASQAEKTISKYSDDNGFNKSGSLSRGPLCCYDCGGPHPWSLFEHRIHVIKCPLANNLGIQENAKKVFDSIRPKRKRKQQDLSKNKNLTTTNFSGFDAASQERIWDRCLINHRYDWHYISNQPCKECQWQTCCVLLRCASPQHRYSLPRAPSQHPIDHAPHQPPTRQRLSDSSSPILCCVVDTAAALCTGNYHFFAAIAEQYPQ